MEAEATGSSEDIELLSYGYSWTEEGVIVTGVVENGTDSMQTACKFT